VSSLSRTGGDALRLLSRSARWSLPQNQPGTPDQLRPLVEDGLWSCRYGSCSLPLRLQVLAGGEGYMERCHDCAICSDGGSVKLERGVSKEQGKKREGLIDSCAS
jgi:hypothetical protein